MNNQTFPDSSITGSEILKPCTVCGELTPWCCFTKYGCFYKCPGHPFDELIWHIESKIQNNSINPL